MALTLKQRRWLFRGALAAIVGLVIIGADLVKSTFLAETIARQYGATRTHVRSVVFDGYWRVTLDADVPGFGGTVCYSVTPILPVVFR
jgi:hypothetical protein